MLGSMSRSNPEQLLIFKAQQVGFISWVHNSGQRVGSTSWVHESGLRVGSTIGEGGGEVLANKRPLSNHFI